MDERTLNLRKVQERELNLTRRHKQGVNYIFECEAAPNDDTPLSDMYHCLTVRHKVSPRIASQLMDEILLISDIDKSQLFVFSAWLRQELAAMSTAVDIYGIQERCQHVRLLEGLHSHGQWKLFWMYMDNGHVGLCENAIDPYTLFRELDRQNLLSFETIVANLKALKELKLVNNLNQYHMLKNGEGEPFVVGECFVI